jgi:hypothetical protein
MEKSANIAKLAKALATFQVKVDKIKKDAKNPFFKSRYASLSNILDAIATPLEESGLAISQHPSGDNNLTTLVMHADSGEYLESTYNIHPTKNDPQATGSAITYARRYALVSILCLNVDDDDDANTATHGYATPQQAATKAAEVAQKPWLNKFDQNTGEITDLWNKVTDAIKAGKRSANQAIEKYNMLKELKQELRDLEKKSA